MEPNTPVEIAPRAPEVSKYLVPMAIVVAGAMIAGAVYLGGRAPSGTLAGAAQAEAKVLPVKDSEHLRGSKSAPIVVIEYSDTECPFCKVFHNTMKQVMSDYDGQVAWVYRHLPIPSLHSKAPHEAEATECVAELGGNQAFWSYLDKIFATTGSNDSLDPAQLPILAAQVGVDRAAFETCLASGKYTEAVNKSATEGFAAGARGTPYSVIMKNGKQVGSINGAEPIASVKAKLDSLLK